VTPRIRPASTADVDAVLSVWRESDAAVSATDDAESLRRLIAHDPDALLLAEEAGRIVGTVVAGWDGWRGAIYRLAVLPAARRRGVATALVREAERRLAARGARRIAAIVIDGEEPATAFWRWIGYEPAPQTRYTRTIT
jgi:ribosomal protein S18 acetylase RimI-like enzyme